MSRVVVADYDYTGTDESQLSFVEGDRIIVLEEDTSGWWTGKLEKSGKEGFFPATYIKEINDANDSDGDKPTMVQNGDNDNDNDNDNDDNDDNDQPLVAKAEFQDIQIQDDNDDNDDNENVKLQTKLQSISRSSISLNKNDKIDNNNSNNSKDKIKKIDNKKYISTADDEKEGDPDPTMSTNPNKAPVAYNINNVDKPPNSKPIIQRTLSMQDNYEGPSDAASENYYSGAVLNLKYNPNAKTRFGPAAHYMSLGASITTIFLGTASWSWYKGSVYLGDLSLTTYDIELFIGLYCFFGGLVLFFWEYFRGDILQKTKLPIRSIVYLLFGIPTFSSYCTALCGVLWINTSIFSFLAWKKSEEVQRKKKKAYSDEVNKSPKDRLLEKLKYTNIYLNICAKFRRIRQQSQLRKYIFVVVYLLFNIVYCLYWAAYYTDVVNALNLGAQSASDVGDIKGTILAQWGGNNSQGSQDPIIVANLWFPIAKMFGNLLDINCAFILFPVCRTFISKLYNISTDQRSISRIANFIFSFIPLDKAIQFHKLCSVLIVIGTIMHTWAHYNHFASVPATYEGIYGETVWISGAIIIIAMHLLYCTSFSQVRHGKFELFWYTHHLFIIFFIAIIFHGAGSINPNYWKWFLAPGVLYIIERIIRELKSRKAVGVVSISHMNIGKIKIWQLELEKTGPIRNHQEGQYIFIKSPIISKFQWHPFTISSPPDQKTLTIHIRSMGEGSWTDRLQTLFRAMSPHKSYTELFHLDGNLGMVPKTIGPDGSNLICIDGPMAAPTQHLGEYKISIIVGAGIGVTPVRATLMSIIYYRFKRGVGISYPEHAYCVWIVNYKQLDAYRFMCRSLKEAEDELYDMKSKSKNTKQMENRLLQFHIFVTSVPADKNDRIYDETVFHNPDNDMQIDYKLWGTHYDDILHNNNNIISDKSVERIKAPFTEEDIFKCLKNPSESNDGPTQIGDIIIHSGRPKWNEFFKPIQTAHRGNKIGVMFCGPDVIAKDLKKNCGDFTDFNTKTVFILHKENF